MNLLIVEDDPKNVEMFTSIFKGASNNISLKVAVNRDDAILAINNEFFDVIVLDLRIPPSDVDLAEDDSHGLAVFEEVSRVSPGTPVLFFTAYGTFELAGELMKGAATMRVFAKEKHPMIDLIAKDQAQKCIDRINEFDLEITALDQIEIEPGLDPIDFDDAERRLVKISTKLMGGVRVELRVIGGGFSPSRTFRFRVRNQEGAIRTDALAKIGDLSDIEKEHAAYENYVAACLRPGQFAHLIKKVTAGAKNKGGIFYSLAGDYEELPPCLFDLLQNAPSKAVQVVAGLRDIGERWSRDTLPRQESLGNIRRLLISDDRFEKESPKLFKLSQVIERKLISIRRCPQHKDLHGLNVLVNPDYSPLLIDYGEVGEGPAGLDAVILELSVITHEKGREALQGWPSRDDVLNWANLDAYLETAPNDEIREFVRSCRDWASNSAGGYNGVLACAYAFTVRQIKYRDVDRIKVFRIIRSCMDRLAKT